MYTDSEDLCCQMCGAYPCQREAGCFGISSPQPSTSRERKIRAAERAAERANAKIERLLSLPEEPTTDDPDGALVVWFVHQFNRNSRKYTYAAVKANDLWYTTGPASPKGLTWDELIDWHMTEVNVDATVWVARSWEPVL